MGLVSIPTSSPILVDTSFLVSVYDKRESRHSESMDALVSIRQHLVTCEAVVTETLYHLRRIPGAPQAILANVQEKRLEIPFRITASTAAVSELMRKYSDTPCDFADACLIQMAHELDTGEILTLDRDFRHYRWRRNRRFNLLIPLD